MNQPQTVRREGYAAFELACNALLGALEYTPLLNRELDGDGIRAQARCETGLSDWGDERFIEAMEVMLQACRNAPLTAFGRGMERELALRGVRNRLRIRRLLAEHPEIAQVKVERPIFVVGFPRTGTTVVQHLLCQEPGWRGLTFWELVRPAPLRPGRGRAGSPGAPLGRDERRRRFLARRDLAAAYLASPEMGTIHHIGADTFEECWYLFANTMAVLNLDIAHGHAAYGDWLLEQDLTWAYREVRTMLQILQWERPAERLVLKCPEHLWFLDALLEVFPDACVVWTHRDPMSVVPSYSSMVSLMRRNLFGGFDPHAVGAHTTHRFAQGVVRAMQVEARTGRDRFYDVDFSQLVTDQVGVVRSIKRHFGLEDTEQAAMAMRGYLATPRPDGRGKHVYNAERFGITRDSIDAAFGTYLDRYNLRRRAA